MSKHPVFLRKQEPSATNDSARDPGLLLSQEHGAVRFAGYAAVFDRVDRGGDVVRAGAIRVPRDVPLLWQHRGQPVGRIERVEADATGLRVIGAVDDPRLAALVAAKAVDGLSFGYRVRAANSGRVREITDLDLVEISLVARPMQPLARVHAVSPSPLVGEGRGPSRQRWEG